MLLVFFCVIVWLLVEERYKQVKRYLRSKGANNLAKDKKYIKRHLRRNYGKVTKAQKSCLCCADGEAEEATEKARGTLQLKV